jgi:probable rRNA maturation factor
MDVALSMGRAGRAISSVWLRRIAAAAMRLAGCSRGAVLEVALVDDATIARLNRRFLRHRGPTDVITFPSGDADTLGEVVISVDRARVQARRYGHALRPEVALLLVHGILHLRGFDDYRPRDRATMQARADAILARTIGRRRGR